MWDDCLRHGAPSPSQNPPGGGTTREGTTREGTKEANAFLFFCPVFFSAVSELISTSVGDDVAASKGVLPNTRCHVAV